MERIEHNEQWKLCGDCQVCRRKNYCSKPCSAKQRANELVIGTAIYQAMDKVTDGAITSTLNLINKE